MSARVFICKLENVLKEMYPHISIEFYASRRKSYIHMGLEKALLSYPEHNRILKDIEEIWLRYKNSGFEFVKPLQLVRTVRWKFGYIVFRKTYNPI